MNIFIAGASGATGRLLTEQLLNQGHSVKAIVRSPQKLPAKLQNHPKLTLIQASLLDLSDAELAQHVQGCDAVASCLGHNLSFKGIYGHPRKLVTEATRRLCQAIKANKTQTKTKFILMNTAGNQNRDLNESISVAEKIVVGLIRAILPPHPDNKQAADYLRTQIGQNDPLIEWVVVRPDSLIDENSVTRYEQHSSPTRSAIFNPGKTSRINVGHFIAELIATSSLWEKWRGQMPVIYNQATAVNA